jgi:hypothetical protein
METTELDRPHRWAERGSWHGFRAVLALDFAEHPRGCEVTASMTLRGRGVRLPVALLLGAVAPYAVRADLRHAAKVLSRAAGDR